MVTRAKRQRNEIRVCANQEAKKALVATVLGCLLAECECKKHLNINTAKSEVVHINSKAFSKWSNLPVFMIGSDMLADKDSPKYIGMMFHRDLNMASCAENTSRAMLTSADRRRLLVRKHTLADRPHASSRLAKTNVVPASMCVSHVWGTGYMQPGKEFPSALQTLL
eukprot:557297-Pelagomonas_calceolata.AAC.1